MLARIFQERGKRLFMVGGCVRDQLLGREISDLDLATDATPEEVKAFASFANPDSLYLVGQKFGTVGLVFGKIKVEITTFRTERYQPLSRWPDVTFSGTLEGDLKRRDFTVNAMAQDPLTGEIVDPNGGREDLEHHVIRAVGKPAERFTEDPLRLLRAVRFASQLGFTLEERTSEAIREKAAMISNVSAERIGEEMGRILLAPHPAHGLQQARDLGLLAQILPELLAMESVPQGPYGPRDALAHSLAALEGVRPLFDLRWAALLHDIGKPATYFGDQTGIHFYNHQVVGAELASTILSRLRLDRRTTSTVVKLVHMHMRPLQYEGSWSDGAVRRLMVDAGPHLDKLLELARADLLAHDGQDKDCTLAHLAELKARCVSLAESHNVPGMRSPLDGNELMAIFKRERGPWLRQVKEHLLSHVLDGALRQDNKAEAERLAREYMAKTTPSEAPSSVDTEQLIVRYQPGSLKEKTS